MKYQPNRRSPRPSDRRWTTPQRRPPGVRPGTPPGAAVPISQAHEPPVRRYIHPIRSNPAPRRDSLEEALAGMLETLSRQTDLLEELLRRTEKGDGGP